jgi:hypothetical protein
MKIPDYYRQFQTDNKKEDLPAGPAGGKSPKEDFQNKSVQPSEKPQAKKPDDKTKLFQGNGFTFNQLEDWQDKTIYTLTGPVTDGIQHNVVINVDKDVPFDTLIDYADWQIKTLEKELKGCMLLKRGETKLNNGTEAYEAIFKWYPVNDFRIYQHQIFILIEKTAYKLTASLTKKTRQTLGPQVERMMLSFNPTNFNKK